MKRSNKNIAAQSLLYFPSITHDAPRLAVAVNRRMNNGTAYIKADKQGLVLSGRRKIKRGLLSGEVVLRKIPVPVKEYVLSDKQHDKRFYPAYMTDSVKVRLIAIEFKNELPLLVAKLTGYCKAIIEREDTLKLAWPVRYIHGFRKWFCAVKWIYGKITGHVEMVSDPAAFSRLLMRGKAQAVIVDFLVKYKARNRSREFAKLVDQFFL
ncbi:hypothetical protein [Chitinophaga filiformis]|uniref:Uncharacterized protein n=1 Tax=Chitinophaga filiformis TaxID=104663 RepID=A0A1G7MDY1_CHIFI|nr:hypothetical protein [Chitinophaga filiformis]SDF59875.1 hypothetical protein SAMN04488121_102385 [Chitinophaga filiformis]